MNTILDERRINQRARLIFNIQENGTGWTYPVPGGGNALRWKAFDSHAHPKYKWIPGKPEGISYYYAPDCLREAIHSKQADHTCWLASGEPDVWALYSAGIDHALSCGYGEGNIPTDLAQMLNGLGVVVLYIAPDLDPAGSHWAKLIATRLAGSGIELDARRLPDELGEKADIGKAWQKFPRPAGFERWLLGLPRYNIEPEPIVQAQITDGEIGDIPAGYRQMVSNALGVTGYGKTGFSRKPVRCPFHDDKHPSASLNEIKGLFCHACGKTYTWTDTAAKLGLQSLSQWIAEHPTLTRHTQLSTETREAMITQGFTTTARVLDCMYAAGFTPGSMFTVKEATRATGLSLMAFYGKYGALHARVADKRTGELFCFLHPVFIQHSKGTKNKINKGKGREAKRFSLPSPEDVARWMGVDNHYHHYDTANTAMLTSGQNYRAGTHAAMIYRKPGQYSLKLLADRLGVSKTSIRHYNGITDIEATPCYSRLPLGDADIVLLPEKQWGTGVWLEDGQGRKYPMARAAAEEIIARGGKVWSVTQRANHYEHKAGG